MKRFAGVAVRAFLLLQGNLQARRRAFLLCVRAAMGIERHRNPARRPYRPLRRKVKRVGESFS
jgi:hypothetical protein